MSIQTRPCQCLLLHCTISVHEGVCFHFQDLTTFVSLDDKQWIKVGEPNYLVAAAKHGRCVLVAQNDTFEVGDHKITKFSLISSVSFVINIPETLKGL